MTSRSGLRRRANAGKAGGAEATEVADHQVAEDAPILRDPQRDRTRSQDNPLTRWRRNAELNDRQVRRLNARVEGHEACVERNKTRRSRCGHSVQWNRNDRQRQKEAANFSDSPPRYITKHAKSSSVCAASSHASLLRKGIFSAPPIIAAVRALLTSGSAASAPTSTR